MSIRCGHCKKTHESVAEVRECAGIQRRINTGDEATEKQFKFLNQLRSERGLEPLEESARSLGKAVFSEFIKELVENRPPRTLYPEASFEEEYSHLENRHGRPVAPSQVKAAAERNPVPAGYYATPSLTGNNDYDFWKVDRPEEGKWAGYVFVKRVIGGQPNQNVRKHQKTNALNAIKEYGIDEARFRFGQELGRCYRCGRHLTDETSRSLSIGPECRSKAA